MEVNVEEPCLVKKRIVSQGLVVTTSAVSQPAKGPLLNIFNLFVDEVQKAS